jgi:hypothetical protein
MSFPFTRALPPIGTRESDTLEFKAHVDTAVLFELAKDVASFANASGGTLLVGACGGSVLSSYKELDSDRVNVVARAYEEAVRDRCAPPPGLRTESLSTEQGFILAVHVEPYPSPVAVKVKGNVADGWGGDSWVFFSRVASQNKDFRPEVLPMLTPETRRIAVLLRSIPEGATIGLALRTRHEGGRDDQPNCTLDSLDETTNRVTFKVAGCAASLSIPLDRIRTAFASHDGRWYVDVDHFFTA